MTLQITGGSPVKTEMLVWLSAIASAFTDNIPFVPEPGIIYNSNK